MSPQVRVRASDHLRGLVAEAEAAAARVAAADPAARKAQVALARRTSARLSAQLDASPLTAETAAAVDEREAAGLAPLEGTAALLRDAPSAGWARVLKVEGIATQEVAAAEYANLLACFDREREVATTFLDDPLEGLAALHEVICHGLVAPDVRGRLRGTDQAVHDGAQGLVLYHAPPPEAIRGLLEGLTAWLTGPAEGEAAVVVAGVVHERLLQWQPFEAGNGRVARSASRVVLRARGLDPEGVGVAERLHAADPLAYHGEVAATMRRRGDLTPWLERASEAVVDGLLRAADALDPGRAVTPPARALAAVRGLEPGQPFTLGEYAARSGVCHPAASEELRGLVAAGVVERQPGARGLRFRRR